MQDHYAPTTATAPIASTFTSNPDASSFDKPPCETIQQLREPVDELVGLTELFASTALSAEQRSYLEAMAATAHRMKSLLGVNEGHTTSAPTSDHFTHLDVDWNPTSDSVEALTSESARDQPPCDASTGCTVRTLLNRAVAAVAPHAHQRQIEIMADVAGNDDDPILLDGDGLGRVLMNLLSNAVTHSNGRRVRLVAVHVRRLHGPDAYRFAVSDDGGSLDPRQSVRLFDASTGTCRGLPACQEWVNRHGGQIEVAVDPGTSTTFWFDLPVSEASSSEPAA